MRILFIADLHLSDKRPDLSQLFLRFLRERAAGTTALYILGDLFEAWIGDDVIPRENVAVQNGLRTLSDSGTPVYIMHGNRDFLLGQGFARQTGATLIPDPSTVDLYGRQALLMHGDTLCTDDVAYQQMRTRLRDPEFIRSYLAKSPDERIAFAQQLRARSQEETRRKQEYIMDVNADAVAAAFRTHRVDLLIHGHTHRLGQHAFMLDNRKVERFVLGDWDRTGNYLVADDDGLRMEPYA